MQRQKPDGPPVGRPEKHTPQLGVRLSPGYILKWPNRDRLRLHR